MGVFSQLLLNARSRQRPMVLIASLPHNDPALAQAALDGGADVVKVHLNVHHHASGTVFGSLAQERPAIEKILRIFEGKPAGVVPGGSAQIDRETLAALPDLGVCFLSLYLSHAVAGWLPPADQVERMLALSVEDGPDILEGMSHLPAQVCELSIMHPDSYGQPFTWHDLSRYASIAQRTHLPLVAPTQHKILPEAVADIQAAGVSAVMIGAIVAGHTPQEWLKTTSAFRKAMDAAWQ